VVISASWLGKVKTVLQIAALFALIAANPAPAWVDALVYLAVAATVISGADYFFGLRRRLERERATRLRHAAARKP
jgi:CDP-diacylglycerol--glycerol-3-phosphate 3-phosphatidyltransferase